MLVDLLPTLAVLAVVALAEAALPDRDRRR